MNDLVKIITPYWQYLSIVAGLIPLYIGVKITFQRKFLDKLMSKDRLWEYKENPLLSEKDSRDYNRFRGFGIAMVGIIFIILGIANL